MHRRFKHDGHDVGFVLVWKTWRGHENAICLTYKYDVKIVILLVMVYFD